MTGSQIITTEYLQQKIYTIRGVQVMLDKDLAFLYGVEIKRLNEQVKRNIERFPERFMFQLTEQELESLRSQTVALSLDNSLRSQFATLASQRGKHRKYLPFAFTEQGVSMLSAVLRSQTAIEVSIKIIDSFVEMRKLISYNSCMFERFEKIEQKLFLNDEKFNQVFKALEAKRTEPQQGIFYNGQMFDAYVF